MRGGNSWVFLYTMDCVNLDDSSDANCYGRWFHYVRGKGEQDKTVTRTCKSKKNVIISLLSTAMEKVISEL